MKDRIKEFMDYKSLSAGELADILEVQRSNISHVLNGRNKPGANFIERLLLNFPDIDARWLMTGIGVMIANNNNASNQDKQVVVKAAEVKSPERPTLKETAHASGMPKMETKAAAFEERSEQEKSKMTSKKRIDKIVVLFDDGTFTDYDKQASKTN